MSWLQRQFGIGRVKTAASDDIMSAAFGLTTGTANPIATSRTAMEKSVWVYRAVSTVATRIASLPWNLYQGEKAVSGKTAVLKRPNPYQTFAEMLEQVVSWQLLKGFGVIYAEPMNIRSLDADMIRVDRGSLQVLEGGVWKHLDPKLIVLFPNLSLSGQTGLSELSTVMDAANMDENAKQVWNNQMNSGGILSGLLSTDVKLTEQELSAIKSRWEERYGGASKAGTMGFLGAGFKFTPMGISAADMKMLEVSQVTRNEIGAAFGVPGIFLNDTESVDYSNAQTQEKILYSNTVCPKADRIADRINVFLLPILGLKGYEFRFDYSQIEALQEDKLQRAQIDETMLRSGVVSINEVRARVGMKPVAGGDAPMVSAMLVPLGAMTVYTRDEVAAVAQAVEDTSSAGASADATTPSKGVSSPADEGRAIQKGISSETRKIIAKSFLSTVRPQEKKFASETMKAFGKQAKDVVAWVEEHEKAAPATTLRETLKDDDLVEHWHSLFVAFGKQALEDVAARYDMSVPDGSAILKWIRAQESKHSKLVNDTTADQISQILADARANGASIPDMVKATKQYFDGIAYRAERVARTNVVACNNAAAQDVYVENGVKQHEWLSTHDERTRGNDPSDECDHVSADGQVVDIGSPFVVSDEELMYPGDPNGSPANTINCRCTILPVV